MTAEILYLSGTKLDHEIELLQELGGGLNELEQRINHYIRLNPDNKPLRMLSNRLRRTSMWLDCCWGELLDQRRKLHHR